MHVSKFWTALWLYALASLVCAQSYTSEEIHWFERMKTAHGVLAAVAWAFLMPTAALLTAAKPQLVWIHAGMQIAALVLWVAAFGIGCNLALYIGAIMEYHPIIGIVLFPLSFTQLISGLIHHRNAKKLERRTWISYVHIWIGRAIVTLGMVNVAFGLVLAAKYAPYDLNMFRTGWIAYGVLAGILWAVWIYIAGCKDLEKARAYNESIYGKSSQSSSPPGSVQMSEA